MDDVKLPQNWAAVTLDDIASWGSGGTPSRKFAHYFCGDIPWIKTGELGSKFIRSSEEKITEEAVRNSSAKIFPQGSVGIAMYGATIGKTSIFGIDASTNQACAVAIPSKAINNEFLYYFLVSEKSLFIKAGAGGAQPNISQGIIRGWPIRLPPLAEQQRIVTKLEELLSELDNGVENLRTTQRQLKVYRQALLKHAFEGKLTAEWRVKNPGKLESPEALLARIQQEREARYQQQLAEWQAAQHAWEASGKTGSKPAKPKAPKVLPALTTEELAGLPELPKGWRWTRLGMLIDEPCYGTSKKCSYEAGGVGVLRIPNISAGRIDAGDLKFADFDNDEISAYGLKCGDLLTIRSNGSISLVGQCALITEEEEDFLYAGYLIRLRPNPSVASPSFLLEALGSHALRKQIEQKAKSTSGVNNINSGEIQSLVVPLCSVEEQEIVRAMLSEKLSNLDQLETTITTALQQAEALRQSILKKAFSGQLVPQDPDDEPASVLLERIRAERAAPKPTAKRGRKVAKSA